MALTRDFRETIKARADRDDAFRSALLSEALDLLLSGNLDDGKAVLRDYINATIGFENLAASVGTPAKSLMRMFSARGNPRADNLFNVIVHLQRAGGIRVSVEVTEEAA